jgi:putative MATE family efflux protein
MSGDRSVELTEGPLLKPLLVLSVPIVLSQLLQVGYNLADTFWVGRLGENAVAALSFSWPIVFLMISLGGGFTVAGTVLVSQHKGAGNTDRVDRVAGQTLSFVTLVGTFFSVVGFVLAPQLLLLVGADPGTEVYRLSVEYTRTLFVGVAFVFGFFIFQALLRGWGDTRTPLYLMAFGVALNVLLDPFLILGFQDNVVFAWAGLTRLEASLYAATGFAGFGVQGAAVATILSRGLGAVVGFAWLFSGKIGIHLSVADLLPRRETVEQIVRIGAPAGIEQSTRALGVTALTALVAYAGTTAVGAEQGAAIAAFGIGSRITSLVFLPAIGLAQGTETTVGQNLGAERVDRAKRAVGLSVALIAGGLAVVSAVASLFATPIVRFFIADSPAVVAVGVDYLRIVAPTYVGLGVFHVVAGGFRGSGSTRTAMAFSLLSLWLFRIPPGVALVEFVGLGPTGVWYAIALSQLLTPVVAGLWFLRGTWTDNVVDAGGAGPGPAVDEAADADSEPDGDDTGDPVPEASDDD